MIGLTTKPKTYGPEIYLEVCYLSTNNEQNVRQI